MRVLYIDTSSSFLYAAIVEDENTLASVEEEFGQNLSEVTMPKIAELFEKANLTSREIDKIIVVNGPGSFTGIRIGITIAKVYAWTTNIPITTITSLEAMAISSKNHIAHVPMINARRNYVYAAIYDENNKEVLKPQHLKLTDLLEKVENLKEFEFISNDEFDETLTLHEYHPDFAKIVNTFKEKKSMNPHAVNPEYLKLTEAEENKL